MGSLTLNKMSVTVGDAALVHDASLALKPGELIALLGPNGAGKTSLIRGVLGLPLSSGSALLNDTNVHKMRAADRARTLAYLPQTRPLAWPNKVRDVVALGRFTYGAQLGRLSPIDARAVEDAMASCNIAHLADRKADTLSGGESARMHCARLCRWHTAPGRRRASGSARPTPPAASHGAYCPLCCKWRRRDGGTA